MEDEQALELLNATHTFPCPFTIKVIGKADDDFVTRVVESVTKTSGADEEVPHSTRTTPNGRHIAVTLEPHLDSAEQVLLVYARIQTVKGVVMTM